jgi:hypothetical protein
MGRRIRYDDDFDYDEYSDDALNPIRRGRRRKEVVSLEQIVEQESYREYGLIYDMRIEGDGIQGRSEHDVNETREYLEDKGTQKKMDFRTRRTHQNHLEVYRAFKKSD